MLPHQTYSLPDPEVIPLLELLEVDEVANHFVRCEVVQQTQSPVERLAILFATPQRKASHGLANRARACSS